MSYSTSYRNQDPKVGQAAFLALIIVVALIGWHLDWVPQAKHWLDKQQTAVKVVERTEVLRQQQAYQRELTHASDNVRVPRNAIVLRGGQVAVVEAATVSTPVPSCTFRCATVRSIPDGLAVSLPVGFSYQTDSGQLTSDPKRYTYRDAHVLKLTYWDPKTNRPHTITAGKGVGSVTLPEFLLQQRVTDLKIGESGYVSNTDVVETEPDKGVAYSFAVVSYMRGNVVFSTSTNSDSVQITRTETGFSVCTPDGLAIFNPKMAEHAAPVNLVPVTLTSDC
jgi:hypothetical protein